MLQEGIASQQSEQPLLNTPQTLNATDAVEEGEPSSAAGNTIGDSHSGGQCTRHFRCAQL